MSRPYLSLALAASMSFFASAAEYRFEPVVGSRQGRVTIKASQPRASFSMPAWAPGDYELFNYGGKVSEIQFYRGVQAVTGVKDASGNKWSIDGGADRVVYLVQESGGNFSPNLRVREDETFVSGPGVFGWFAGEDMQTQTLKIAVRPGDSVAIALPTSMPDDGWIEATARGYTEMIDSPFVVGSKILTATFEVGGKKHRMVGYGASAGADMASFAGVAKPIVEQNLRMFGSLPYQEYVFFCDFNGGYGGLEHLSSTRLGIYSKNASQAAGLIAHEYFHAFNVKTIREQPLGPFDYSKPANVSTLWWLEGVTDYYADVMRLRAGLIDEEDFLNDVGGSYAALLRNQARLKVTAAESSEKVWTVRGSQGWGGLSYYHKGKLIGVCLDLAIRLETKGARSLDDVIKALYEETKDRKPGYAPNRIRELCIQFGGEKLGPIYDRCVSTTQELPMDDLLSQAGFVREDRNVHRMDGGGRPTKWPLS